MGDPENNKKAEVGKMFDSIAFRYDFLNHFLSFGTDFLWRRKAINVIGRSYKNPEILDVATGTCDLAIGVMRLKPSGVTGIDLSEKMLEIGKQKIIKKKLEQTIRLMQGCAEELPYSSNTFDVTMVAFGVRNFADPVKGLSEMYRVLRDGGMIMVLEFSKPVAFPFKQIYYFYFTKILPLMGRLFSKSKNAYTYLPESVMLFPDNEDFLDLLKSVGFKSNIQKKLSGGIASIYTGLK